MTQRLIFTIILICIATLGFSQNSNILVPKTQESQKEDVIQAYFGISLLTSYNGFIRYGYIQIKPNGETKISYLTRQEFIYQVTGQERSKANPDGKNLLAEKQIKWDTFEDLWKLRYTEYPYDGPRSKEQGWAGRDFAPSVAQWDFLKKNYGYQKFTQFLYGEDMWRLVKDSQDPNWQNQYSSLR